MEDPRLCVGIDLGTSNSCIAYADNKGVVKVCEDNGGFKTTPSWVSFDPKSKAIWYGRDAKMQQISNVKNTVYASKRLIGRNVHDKSILADLSLGVWDLDTQADGTVVYNIQHDNKQHKYSPVEIATCVLDNLCRIAEQSSGKQVSEAVITVPAYFSASQRQATLSAAYKAGIKTVRLVSEPTAAALAYFYNKQQKALINNTSTPTSSSLSSSQSQYILVYDLGGGTLDVSLVESTTRTFQVKATAGNPILGGENIDHDLFLYCVKEIKRIYPTIDVIGDLYNKQQLMQKCVAAKEQLSHTTNVTIDIESIVKHEHVIELSRSQFRTITQNTLKQCLVPVKQVLASAGLEPHHITDVILVGGTTRIPFIQQQITSLFKHATTTIGSSDNSTSSPSSSSSSSSTQTSVLTNAINQDEAIVRGAALIASRLTSIPSQANPSIPFESDVLSFPYFVRFDVPPPGAKKDTTQIEKTTSDFIPLLPPNTRLPAKSQDISWDLPVSVQKRGWVDIAIFQGSSNLFSTPQDGTKGSLATPSKPQSPNNNKSSSAPNGPLYHKIKTIRLNVDQLAQKQPQVGQYTIELSLLLDTNGLMQVDVYDMFRGQVITAEMANPVPEAAQNVAIGSSMLSSVNMSGDNEIEQIALKRRELQQERENQLNEGLALIDAEAQRNQVIVDNLNQQIKDLLQKNNQLNKQIETQNTTISTLQYDVEQYKCKYKTLEEQYNKSKETYTHELSELNVKIKNIHNEYNTTSNNINDTYNNKIKLLNDDVNTLTHNNADLVSQLDRITIEYNKYKADTQQQIKQLQSNIDGYKNAALIAEQNATEQIHDAVGLSANQAQIIIQLKQDIIQLNEHITNMTNNNTIQHDKISALEEDKRLLEHQLTISKQNNKVMQQKYDDCIIQLNNITNEYTQYKTQYNSDNIDNIKTQIYNDITKQYNTTIQHNNNEIKSLREQLELSKEQYNDLEYIFTLSKTDTQEYINDIISQLAVYKAKASEAAKVDLPAPVPPTIAPPQPNPFTAPHQAQKPSVVPPPSPFAAPTPPLPSPTAYVPAPVAPNPFAAPSQQPQRPPVPSLPIPVATVATPVAAPVAPIPEPVAPLPSIPQPAAHTPQPTTVPSGSGRPNLAAILGGGALNQAKDHLQPTPESTPTHGNKSDLLSGLNSVTLNKTDGPQTAQNRPVAPSGLLQGLRSVQLRSVNPSEQHIATGPVKEVESGPLSGLAEKLSQMRQKLSYDDMYDDEDGDEEW